MKIVDTVYAQSFQTKLLKLIFNRFPILNTVIKQQSTKQGCRGHALLNHSNENVDPSISVEERSRVFNIKKWSRQQTLQILTI